MSLFGGLWHEAAASLDLPLSAIVMLRHPREVAESLAVRDGIGAGTAMVLWLDYMLSAIAIAESMPSTLVAYDDLLSDWRGVADRIRALPGGDALDFAGASTRIDDSLKASLRHHAHADDSGLPAPIAETWRCLCELAGAPNIPAGTASSLRGPLAGAIDLLGPFADDQRLGRRRLWERVARAEEQLAPSAALLQRVPGELAELRERMDRHQSRIVDSYTSDVRAMQQAHASALQAAARAQGEAQRADQERNSAQEARRRAEEELAAARQLLAASQETLEAARRELETERAQATQALEEARRELGVLRAEAERGREAAAWLERVVRSRSWRMTRPIRVLGRFVRGEGWDSDARRLRLSWRRLFARLPLVSQRVKHLHLVAPLLRETNPSPVTETEAAAVGLAPAPALDQVPDVFVWAVIDWHFRIQRPQHLARALAAKGHRVFYVSNNFVDDARAGFGVLPLDDSGRLFQLHLNVAGAPQIYADMPDAAQLRMLRASLAQALCWSGTRASVSIVQHPYWSQVATMVPSPRIVYDCMDHHAGFDNNAAAILEAERQLIADADVVVVTSDGLAREVEADARHVIVVRNAGDFAFFSNRPPVVFEDPARRPVIGYYGAIATWFDVDLVRAVARAFPEALILLVGADTAGVGSALADIGNVRCVGEVKYEELPYWLHGFDVCLLPFKVLPLTLATNPVKVYEYLAAGKPVVAVDLPEMRQFDGLVDVAADERAFVDAVGRLLSGNEAPVQAAARRAFARNQTWEQRADQLDVLLRDLPAPRVSVIVLTYNNLALTQACLSSIERDSDYQNLEVIVVDNLSADGSRDWLQAWAAEQSPAGHARRLILNDRNAGFAAGNNIGLRAASGDYLVILNNDTQVTPGWVRTLIAHFRRDATLGLVGPVTNNIGNEAKVDLEYADMEEMVAVAGAWTRAHAGEELPLHTAAFFCVAMPRAVFAAVGELDESFGLGFFEDDDYCRRVEAAGYRIACAEDVFVHHHLSASFNKLGDGERSALFQRNRARYEEKWGIWEPHAYRDAGEPS
jgi:GT2 family glycosyltransferase/glycosyltransferase involved in cell wall biosynthesis